MVKPIGESFVVSGIFFVFFRRRHRKDFLIPKFSEFALYGKTARTFFHVPDDACINMEGGSNIDDCLCMLRTEVYLHAVAHIEYFVHFSPICTALFCNNLEEGWNREHIVLDNTAMLSYEVKHLCLGSSRAMNHAMDNRAQMFEYLFDDRGIGTGRRQY